MIEAVSAGGRPDPPRVVISVPATSANLGPGFDALGLALTLRDEIEIGYAPSGLDGQPQGLALRCRNVIPHGRGLGSSAAAIVAGIAGAYVLARGPQQLDRDWVLALAAHLEGHADNVAACIFGGLTIAWTDASGTPAVARVEPAEELRPVVLLPEQQQSTKSARAALPSTVSHADAAFTAGRAALLIAAITARPELLYAATEDRLHQPQRAAVMPETASLVERLRAAGLPAVVSGAGPAILVLARAASLDELQTEWRDRLPAGWILRLLQVDRGGLQVR